MKSKTGRTIDNILLFSVGWLLAFLVARYYLTELYLAVIAATVLAMGVFMLAGIGGKKGRETEENGYKAALCAEHFLYRDEHYALDYICDALKTKYPAVKKKSFIRINDTIIAPALSEPLSLKKTVAFYAEALREKAKTLVILAPASDKTMTGIKERLRDIKLEVFEKDRVYRLLKSLDRIPKTEEKQKRGVRLRSFITSALQPKRAKGYLFAALTFIFGAYFSTMSIYFIVMASLCLTLALMSLLRISDRFKKEPAKN